MTIQYRQPQPGPGYKGDNHFWKWLGFESSTGFFVTDCTCLDHDHFSHVTNLPKNWLVV